MNYINLDQRRAYDSVLNKIKNLEETYKKAKGN